MTNIQCDSVGGETSALYARLLGTAWFQLDDAVRKFHLQGDTGRFSARGLFTIEHGHSRLARWLCRILALPDEGEAVGTRLVVRREGLREQWRRTFNDQQLATVQWEGPAGLLAERFGRLELCFRLEADDGGLHYESVRTRVRLGRLMLRLPGRLSPQVSAREQPAGDGAVRVAVQVTLPLVGMLISYTGQIESERAQ